MEIKISKELTEKLEQRIKQTDFNSVQEYIVYVLEQMTSTNEDSKTETYSKEEEEALKRNLKEMGYL